jgi:hypothetical protein
MFWFELCGRAGNTRCGLLVDKEEQLAGVRVGPKGAIWLASALPIGFGHLVGRCSLTS